MGLRRSSVAKKSLSGLGFTILTKDACSPSRLVFQIMNNTSGPLSILDTALAFILREDLTLGFIFRVSKYSRMELVVGLKLRKTSILRMREASCKILMGYSRSNPKYCSQSWSKSHIAYSHNQASGLFMWAYCLLRSSSNRCRSSAHKYSFCLRRRISNKLDIRACTGSTK